MTLTLTPAALRAHVARAGARITPTWPLSSFIAVNPLSNYEHLPFGEHSALPPGVAFTRTEREYQDAHRAGEISVAAIREAIHQTIPELVAIPAIAAGGRSVSAVDIALVDLMSTHRAAEPGDETDTTPAFDQLVSRWLALLLGLPVWQIGSDDHTLYRSFRRLASHDRTLSTPARRRLASLPDAPEDTIQQVLNSFRLPTETLESALSAQLDALPGWSSHLAWRASHSPTVTLTDYIALRLALHWGLAEPLPSTQSRQLPSGRDIASDADRIAQRYFGSPAHRADVMRVLMFLDQPSRCLIWQTAAEVSYRSGLFHALADRTAGATEPTAQLVFCIDTRSEGLRRHIETDPMIETLGFPGFFAAPLHYRPWAATEFREHYPALLSGGIRTTEKAVAGTAADRRRVGLFGAAAAAASVEAAASTPVASFSWAETAGWVSGVSAAARTILPGRTRRITGWFRSKSTPQIATEIDICDRLSVNEQTELAEAALRMMGLTDFAPLVVFTGHRSTTRNNLYQAALDCGACGGNGGAPNARAAAAIFNSPPVRATLAERGLPIPATTRFLAAEHDTSTDTVTVLDTHLVPATHAVRLTALVQTLSTAADTLTRERARTLPGATRRTRLSRIRVRADDWAEMYPELGLAGNAALLIGPREVSRSSNLDRRVFLQSYDAAADPDGSGLAAIMTAPLIVAQWINHQYYFSTLNPQRYGAGNKTLHNPIHDLGVLSGQTGDLKVGLPWQSVAAGERLLHTPLRLSVLIQAPLDRIGRIISATDTLRNLLDNQWISLHARPDSAAAWTRYTNYGFATTERNNP